MTPEQLNPPTPPDATEALVSQYIRAVETISAKLEAVDPVTLTYRKQVAMLREIDRILHDLGVYARAWLDEHLVAMYSHGQATALLTLGEAATFAAAVDMVASIGLINEEAVRAIVNDAHTDLLAATAKVSEDVKRQVREIVAEHTRLAKATSEKARNVAKRVSVDLNRLNAPIIDAAGRRWKVEDYARVVVKSKLSQAHREGAIERAVADGFDLARISAHGAKDACRNFEGAIISLTGATPGYPTLGQLRGSRLIFHPMCKHVVNPINPSLLPESERAKAEEIAPRVEEALRLAAEGKMNSHGSKKGA